MSQRSFHVFAGTRPEVVKVGPAVSALRDSGAEVVVVATGQQSDPALIDATFAAAGIRPDVVWQLDSTDYFDRSGELYANALRHLSDAGPQAVAIVQGDTTTVPLVSHAARRVGRPVVHIEAGLRSLNEQSLEESNRKIAAATASIHFAPTELAADCLKHEGVDSTRIFVVGNTACDALRLSGVPKTPLAQRRGVMFTAHRATNVDDPQRLRTIVDIVADLASKTGHVLFPLHPRTRDRAQAFGLLGELEGMPGLTLCDPLPYDDMLVALTASRLVVTDSGGLQEEAAWFGIPCIVMRQSTPRWEGIAEGSAALAGVSRGRVAELSAQLLQPESLERVNDLPCPYGDGYSGRHIADVLMDPGNDHLLDLREPDYTDGSLPVR